MCEGRYCFGLLYQIYPLIPQGFANAGFTGESKNGNFENPEQMVMGHANTHFTINRSPSNSKRVLPNNGNGDSARGPDNTRM